MRTAYAAYLVTGIALVLFGGTAWRIHRRATTLRLLLDEELAYSQRLRTVIALGPWSRSRTIATASDARAKVIAMWPRRGVGLRR